MSIQALVGTNGPMTIEAMLNLIDARVKAIGPSERKILLNADLDLSTIKRIRNRGQIPGPQVLAALEAALRLPPGALYSLVANRPSTGEAINLETVFVRGEVQAGVWRDAIEWDPMNWVPLTIPLSSRYGGIQRFGLLVRGDSMNRLYPEGTVVVVVRFWDLGRQPATGERVVTLQRGKSEDYEATIKEYEFDAVNSRHLLWPRSTAPEFQAPIILPATQALIDDRPFRSPYGDDGRDQNDPMFHLPQAGDPDVMIAGLVIGSYRPEPEHMGT